MPIQFIIPGKAQGFVSGARFWSKKTSPMRLYSQHVREVAGKYISLPLVATKEKPLYLDTIAYFPSGVHCDPENVHKLVKDSLFYIPKNSDPNRVRGSDKYTGGIYQAPLYDKENPRVEVIIYLPEEIHLIKMRYIASPIDLTKYKSKKIKKAA